VHDRPLPNCLLDVAYTLGLSGVGLGSTSDVVSGGVGWVVIELTHLRLSICVGYNNIHPISNIGQG